MAKVLCLVTRKKVPIEFFIQRHDVEYLDDVVGVEKLKSPQAIKSAKEKFLKDHAKDYDVFIEDNADENNKYFEKVIGNQEYGSTYVQKILKINSVGQNGINRSFDKQYRKSMALFARDLNYVIKNIYEKHRNIVDIEDP